MTDGWPLYESHLKDKFHVISKRYTERIEQHNLNLRRHLARLGRKSESLPKNGLYIKFVHLGRSCWKLGMEHLSTFEHPLKMIYFP